MKKSVLLCLLLVLTGCVPRYATIRPHYEVDVRNASGEALSNATMWVITTSMPPPGIGPLVAKFDADAQGHISVEKQSQWETIIFFLHGTNFYSFYWCVEAPGYFPRSGSSESINSPLILNPARQPTRCDVRTRDEGDLYK